MADPTAISEAASSWQFFAEYVGVAGFVISLVLAAFRIVEFFRNRNDRSKDQQAKVDDAWFKTIVLDGAIPALRDFLQEQRYALKQAGHLPPAVVRPHIAVLLAYSPKSEDLKLRLKPIEELSANAYETMVRAIEGLDDLISPYCAHADDAGYDRKLVADEWIIVEREIDKCFRDCLAVLRRVHYALQQAKNPDKEIAVPSTR